MRDLYWSLAACLTIFGLFATPSRAGVQKGDDSAADALAVRILTEGWERGPKSRNESQSWFEQASGEVRSAPEVLWAYALNRLQHRKYRDAMPPVDTLVRAGVTDWDVAYAQIWLASFDDEYQQAIALMRQLKTRLDATPNLDAAVGEENYFRMGRICGYLQGPAGNRVAQASLEQLTTLLKNGASDESWKAFTDQRDAVVRQYEQLMAARQDKHDAQMDSLVRQQAADLDAQNKMLVEMEQQTMDAQSNRDRVVAEGESRVRELRERLDALTAEWNAQQSQIATLRLDIGLIWNTIAQIDDALRNERDPVIRRQLLQDRSYYLVLSRDRDYQLATQRASSNGVYAELSQISLEHDATRGEYQSRVSALDQSIASAQKERSRIQRKIRDLQENPKVSNSLLGSIEAEAAALASYDPFPAEMLKLRLLDRLQAAD